jgi:hypothetical protein
MYIARFTAWVFLFVALAGWGAECLYSLQSGSYQFLTPVAIWQVISPVSAEAVSGTTAGTLSDVAHFVFLARPIWLLPAIIGTILFLAERRRKKKWMFRDN